MKSQNRRNSILPVEGAYSANDFRQSQDDSIGVLGDRLGSRSSGGPSMDFLMPRKPGRYDAINTLRSVQTADTRSEALQSNRRSGFEPSYGYPYGSRDSTLQPQSAYLMPPSHNSTLPSLHGNAPLQKRPGALWDADDAEEIGAFRVQQHLKLSMDSSIEDIRKYGQSVQHPGKLMNVLPDEYDREVQTEFDVICNELLNVLGEFETALEEMTIWKDDFLKQTVPSNIKLQLTLLFARLFRSKSDLHEPMFELIKQVRVYSRPWLNKSFSLVELEKDYQRQCHLIDVAIRKMEQMQLQIATVRSEKRVALWERLTHKVMEVYPDYAGQFVDAEPIIPPPVINEPSKEEPKPTSADLKSNVEASDEHLSQASSLSGDSDSDEDDGDDAKNGNKLYGTVKVTPHQKSTATKEDGDLGETMSPQGLHGDDSSDIGREDEDDELESRPDEVFESEGPVEEIEYMGDYDDEDIEEAVNRFLEERPMTFPDALSSEQAERGIEAPPAEEQPVGERKVSFTLQEIMELTMLHGQQMQLLQFEYE
ncbi:hypothetical protein HDU86_007955 [Geranomyces michiganensis]|nr:hypothetical protein HDU86_007955 [Geranomyces michiganensis]